MGLLYVALGGAVGAVARYGLSGFVYQRFSDAFPWGTVTVNVVGSLVLGFAVVYFENSLASPELRKAVTIGLLGSFTTFSTFAYESVALLQDGEWGRAGGYVLGSVVLASFAVVVGLTVASVLIRPRG